jgi:adenine phosphoribosyltransferase/phosphomevalonate kinase
MATLDTLKLHLRKSVTTKLSATQPLSHAQYSAGFDIMVQGPGWRIYQDFIVPQLSRLLAPLIFSRVDISVLEIGPGPKSVLGYLPAQLRMGIRRYAAFEPDGVFAMKLEEWLCSTAETGSPLPCLESSCRIYRKPFDLDNNTGSGTSNSTKDSDEKFDVILFCHSMYGMKPKGKFIERALEMLDERLEGGMVVVFHREGMLHLDGLTCSRSASFPTGVTRVADEDEILDSFAAFIAGYVMLDEDVDRTVRAEWREVCRTFGRHEEAEPGHLVFSSPTTMAVLTQSAVALPELLAQVPFLSQDKIIKNPEARLHRAASIVRPTEVRHVQRCVQWAMKHSVGLTVLGGGHSGHCIRPNVVSVDMDAFDQIHILTGGERGEGLSSDPSPVVTVGAGCKTGEIVRMTLAAGLTVPLGSRPSVGAGLWLQGGIGHLARLYGLGCDAILGAVVVSVDTGEILCLGHVPAPHRPAGATRPQHENDMLWAIKGAGNNFGIVISVTFKAYAAPNYLLRTWLIPLGDSQRARSKLADFDAVIASRLPRTCSADTYLYWDAGELHLGVTVLEASTEGPTFEMPASMLTFLGPEHSHKAVDGVGLFETEFYMSGMHGGHGGGKTSSFKRCVFLKHIGAWSVTNALVAAVETRPSPLCYLHLLHGGGAACEVVDDATAFGCRDWEFACVVTGVWPRDLDGTNTAQAAVRWVYNTIRDLLPLSVGAYGADLGPDPRDTAMAAKAFGPNRPRLARLKHTCDPRNILAYACPLPRAPTGQSLIILVTGESGAGKDYCASIWVDVLTACTYETFTARAVSISDATKQEYAAATGADLERLIWDRGYKEQHRPDLTMFFQHQVQQRPQLLEEHFLRVVYGAKDVDVLLITGMRDEAPVAGLSHLVPSSRLIEVRVTASEDTRRLRRSCHIDDNDDGDTKCCNGKTNSGPDLAVWDHSPSLVFDNDDTGAEAAKRFAEQRLLPFLQPDLQRLGNMVQRIPDFPRSGIDFRHVLNISQQPGGLNLCTSLLQAQFTGDWSQVDAVACCEAGGFVYASTLAAQVGVPLALIREAGKLPPPTVSVLKPQSHVSSWASTSTKEKRIEMGRDVVPRGSSVVVADDVLATGQTLCAVLQLLGKVGISTEDMSIMVVAEFPIHRGRELLRRHGFGKVKVQSLLVFDGV